MEGLYIAVRGGIEDLSEPKIFFTEKAQKFVSSVLRVEPQHLGLKLEAFVVGKLGTCFLASLDGSLDLRHADEHVISNNSRPLNKLIAECRELIQDGLGRFCLLLIFSS